MRRIRAVDSAEGFGIEPSWLEGTPFPDYTIPGLFLFFVIGGGMLVALSLALVGSGFAALAAIPALKYNLFGLPSGALRIPRASRLRSRWRVCVTSERQTTRYEFMSPGWVEMARDEITRALSMADLANEQFTLCEEFTSPPDHLRRGDAETIGFYVRLVGGQAEIGDDSRVAADCRIISDYADALTVARDPDAPAADPTEVQRRIAEGTLKIEGDPSRMPEALQHLDIHRLLAGHTL